MAVNAELKNHNNAMTLFIDGKPVPFTTYKPTEAADDGLFIQTVRKSLKDISQCGLHVHFVPTFFDWPDDGKYDFSRVDLRVREVIKTDPLAYVIIRIQSESLTPDWWMRENPDAVFQCGTGKNPELPPAMYSTVRAPSLGSDFWQTQGLKALEALAGHVKKQDYAEKVIGYLPTAYNSNEWFFRTYHDLRVTDICPAMQKAFCDYLQKKTNSQKDFTVPGRIERGYGDYGYIYHPDALESVFPVVEYYRFINTLCAETIIDVTKTLRRTHEPQKIIVGTFYGYSLGLANFYWLADSGHLDLQRLLEKDGPDFTCSPLEYFTRNFREKHNGGFCWSQSTAADSARIAGKAYFGEDDSAPPDITPAGWSKAKDNEEDAENLKRNFVFSLCKGQLMWWYDLHGHWYETKERIDVIENCVRIAKEALNTDRQQISEVGVIMDEQAPWYITLDRQFQRAMFWENFHNTFSRAGVAVDLFGLGDIHKTDLKKYKIIFMPTCFCLNNKQRQIIESLKSDSRTIVFYQATGFINPENKSNIICDKNIYELTGINVKSTKSPFQLKITTDDRHPLTKNCEDICFGVETEKPLNFFVEDGDTETLGYYSGRGPVGLAIKKFDKWTSIYCAVPSMPYVLSRNLMKYAGVHIYCEDYDVIYANKSYVGLFVLDGQVKQIKLPGKYKVRECFSDNFFSDSPIDEINFNAKLYHTYLFELRNGD